MTKLERVYLNQRLFAEIVDNLVETHQVKGCTRVLQMITDSTDISRSLLFAIYRRYPFPDGRLKDVPDDLFPVNPGFPEKLMSCEWFKPFRERLFRREPFRKSVRRTRQALELRWVFVRSERSRFDIAAVQSIRPDIVLQPGETVRFEGSHRGKMWFQDFLDSIETVLMGTTQFYPFDGIRVGKSGNTLDRNISEPAQRRLSQNLHWVFDHVARGYGVPEVAAYLGAIAERAPKPSAPIERHCEFARAIVQNANLRLRRHGLQFPDYAEAMIKEYVKAMEFLEQQRPVSVRFPLRSDKGEEAAARRELWRRIYGRDPCPDDLQGPPS